MIESSGIRLLDQSSVAEARRASVGHAARAGLGQAETGNTAIIATELATNMLRHARDGVLAITSRAPPPGGSVLLVAADQGPGITDVAQCFADGYSSAGSTGTGLGAVARLSTFLDLCSSPAGTVLAAEIMAQKTAAPADRPCVGGIALAKEGQSVNGDAWDCRRVDRGVAVVVCDGLGHGEYASEASARIVATFREAEWHGPREMLAAIHQALRPTRGAAAAIAFIDSEAGRVRYCGIGNISSCVVAGGRSRHLVSHNGILGHTVNRLGEFEYDWSPESVLVMHSDGISARWQPSDLAALWHRHPGLIAGVLYRDFARGNDDTVAAVVSPAWSA